MNYNNGGTRLTMQNDGNLCVYGPSNNGIYCAYTQGSWGANSYAQIQNNGVFGVYTSAGVLIKGTTLAGTEGLIPAN